MRAESHSPSFSSSSSYPPLQTQSKASRYQSPEKIAYRLTQAGILRALTWPCFFLSTVLGSLVIQPAVNTRLVIGQGLVLILIMKHVPFRRAVLSAGS